MHNFTPIIEHSEGSRYKSERTGRKISRRGTRFYTWEFMYEDHGWTKDLNFQGLGVMNRICLEITFPYYMYDRLYVVKFDSELRKQHVGLLTADTWQDVLQMSLACWVHDQREGITNVVKNVHAPSHGTWFRPIKDHATGEIETYIVDNIRPDYRIAKLGGGERRL